jgi:hypothetical protein
MLTQEPVGIQLGLGRLDRGAPKPEHDLADDHEGELFDCRSEGGKTLADEDEDAGGEGAFDGAVVAVSRECKETRSA